MRNLKMIAAIFTAAIMFTACEKDENSGLNSNQYENTKASKIGKDLKQNKSGGDFQYVVSGDDLIDEVDSIVALTPPLLDPGTIKITPLASTPDYLFEFDADGNPGSPPPSPDKIVCDGSGWSFANCVRAWFDENPNGCLTIQGDNGNFTADDDC